MDGHFVPNLTFGPDVIASCRSITHRAVRGPPDGRATRRPARPLRRGRLRLIIVHAETATPPAPHAGPHPQTPAPQPAVALNPATPVDGLRHVLDLVDMVLVMTVNPGFGGQAYIATMEPKIAEVRALVVESRLRHRHRGRRRHRPVDRRRRGRGRRQRARRRVGAVPRPEAGLEHAVSDLRGPRRGGRRGLRRRLAAARRPPRGPRSASLAACCERRRQPGELLRPAARDPRPRSTWSGTSTRPSPSSSTTGSRTQPTAPASSDGRRRARRDPRRRGDASPRRSRRSSRPSASDIDDRDGRSAEAELASPRRRELLGAGPSAQTGRSTTPADACGDRPSAPEPTPRRRRWPTSTRPSPRDGWTTSSMMPYSLACSAVNQRSRSESSSICSTVWPVCSAMRSAMSRLM